jgi:hypothetical protein
LIPDEYSGLRAFEDIKPDDVNSKGPSGERFHTCVRTLLRVDKCSVWSTSGRRLRACIEFNDGTGPNPLTYSTGAEARVTIPALVSLFSLRGCLGEGMSPGVRQTVKIYDESHGKTL